MIKLPISFPIMPPLNLINYDSLLSSKEKRLREQEKKEEEQREYSEQLKRYEQQKAVDRILSLQRKENHISREEELELENEARKARVRGFELPDGLKWHRSDNRIVPDNRY